jgi:hypothetical protein
MVLPLRSPVGEPGGLIDGEGGVLAQGGVSVGYIEILMCIHIAFQILKQDVFKIFFVVQKMLFPVNNKRKTILELDCVLVGKKRKREFRETRCV